MMRGGRKIKNIGSARKMVGAVALGLASKNIGKNYHGNICR